MNSVIANQVVVSAKFWKEGLSNELKQRDEQAKQILKGGISRVGNRVN